MSSYGRSGGGSGFWSALAGLLIGAGGLYGYNVLKPDNRVVLDLGDVEDYAYFLEEEGDVEPPEPFKAEPLEVRAMGEVKAAPDIAVVTAIITAEDQLESRAVDNVALRVNAVQTAISGFDVDVSVTDSKTSREYDPLCHEENREAQRRHNEINSDYWFNKRLNDQGDTKTKRREAKPRIKQKICNAKSIKALTSLVLRINPPEAAGDVLQALADAGADRTRLYGYDFSNYDALYQEAASKAVTKARAKAEMIARHTKAELGEIVGFYVGAPARTGRFGPQPTIINKSSARNRASSGYRARFSPAPTAPVIVNGVKAEDIGRLPHTSLAEVYESVGDEVIVSAARSFSSQSKRKASKRADYEQNEDLQDDIDEAGEEDSVPTTTNNALQMSLLSGPKAIRVSALLAYDYKTVIDGSILPEEDR